MTEKISKAITLSRFPLIFLVIVLHSYFAEIDYSQYPVFSNITCLLSFVVTRVAVPLFFAISGYLFFNKVEIMDLKLYQFKLKKRVKSLLIPYILWNVLFFLAYLFIIKFQLVPVHTNGKTVYDYSFTDFAWSLYNTKISVGEETPLWGILSGNGCPIAYHMWFVRDLMVTSILSPIIYFLVGNKISRFIYLPVIIVVWACVIPFLGDVGYYLSSITFFSLGAWISVNKINIEKVEAWNKILIAYALAVGIELYLYNTKSLPSFYHNVTILLGLLTFTVVLLKLSGKVKIPRILSGSTFFIYGGHLMFILLTVKLLQRYVPHNEEILIIAYLCAPIIVCVFLLGCWVVLKNLSPRLAEWLNGGR